MKYILLPSLLLLCCAQVVVGQFLNPLPTEALEWYAQQRESARPEMLLYVDEKAQLLRCQNLQVDSLPSVVSRELGHLSDSAARELGLLILIKSWIDLDAALKSRVMMVQRSEGGDLMIVQTAPLMEQKSRLAGYVKDWLDPMLYPEE